MSKMTKAQRRHYEALCARSGIEPELDDEPQTLSGGALLFVWTMGALSMITLYLRHPWWIAAAAGAAWLLALIVAGGARRYSPILALMVALLMSGMELSGFYWTAPTTQLATLPTPAAQLPPVRVVQAAEREQVPMPVLPTLAPAPPRVELPTALPTPLPMPTAEILPQPTQPAAVTVEALPPLYQHPDTGNLYPSGPTATLEPLPTPPPPVPAGEYRLVWVADPAGGQKECVVYDNRRACSFAGIQPGSVEFLAGALKSGLMPGEPHDASQEVTQ